MSAIYGLWRFDERQGAADFRRMGQALSRYGTDDHQVWSEVHAPSLGRRLHRSLPEDRFRTPLEMGRRYVIVGDVRLTEREDLACRLGLGDEASKMSDAAIAGLAVETWHEQAFDQIYGAFAIAAWDRQERRLLLARDHLGHKPLLFHSAGHFLAFASMPDGLHALPDIPRCPDIESMKRFLALQYPSDGKTHYDGIARVMPGHYAIATIRELVQRRYWNPDLTPLRLATRQAYVDALAKHLDRAVASALRGAEGKVGAHLSSGFDSTAVATTAARQLAPRGGTVVAYTAAPRVGYEMAVANWNADWNADESLLARATADMHPNIEHEVIRSDRTPMANLGRTASIYGIPVLNICNETWWDAINDHAAKRGITVMLDAFMGNATISETGASALHELLRGGRIVSWLKLGVALRRKGMTSWRSILWNSFSPWIPNGPYRWLTEHRYGPSASPLKGSALKQDIFRATIRDAATETPVPRYRDRVLTNGWIRPTGRGQDDRLTLLACDAVGVSGKGMLAEWKIDYRDPTADRRLVEFSLRVPTEQLIQDGEPRTLLRRVLADRVPSEVLNNRLKGYQAADWHEWLDQAREDVIDEVNRIEMFEPSAGLIDVERLKALVDNWPERGSEAWTAEMASIEYRCCLLRAISAASFMRQAARSNY